MTNRIGQLVLIEWYDIVAENAWQPITHVLNYSDMECEAVGWVMFEDKNVLQLCMIHDPDHKKEANNIAIFPKGCIKSIHKLEMP